MSFDNIQTWFENIRAWSEQYPYLSDSLEILGVLILSLVVYFIAKKYLIRILSILIRRSKTQYDDIILERIKPHRIAYIAPLLVLYNFAYLIPSGEQAIRQIIAALIIGVLALTIGAFLDSLHAIYQNLEKFHGTPIKGYIEIVKIFIFIVGAILVISLFTGKSPLGLLSGIGAITAVLLLIFRDTILSLVASFQITSGDLVKVGDWIEVPKFGADGDVIDIALHTVKIQNWDKTISVIPTHELLMASFRNWRGMTESGGRRIKRAIHIDVNSIKFCDDDMIKRFEKIHLLTDYVKQKQQEVKAYNQEQAIDLSEPVDGRRMTNVGTFRAYIKAYLRNHNKISQDMTLLVRQLAPGPHGLPIEIYAFTNDTAWSNYEAIQADVFDHLFAIASEFDLKVFQYPTGKDLESVVDGGDQVDGR
jgi:miniconductance mechanosensitive channel